MNCELLEKCPFFNTLDSVGVELLKKVYCRGKPLLCARRQVANAIGRERVPLDLKPNHDYRVQGILKAVSSEQ